MRFKQRRVKKDNSANGNILNRPLVESRKGYEREREDMHQSLSPKTNQKRMRNTRTLRLVVAASIVNLVILIVTLSLRRNTKSSIFVREQSQSNSLRVPEISPIPTSTCEEPSLPKGEVHVVIGGYKEVEAGLAFDDVKNYLWDLELTNADVFWYRRVQSEIPLRTVQGKCGITLHERMLLPNYGRDGAALYDYIVEHYHNPPEMLVFLHGHAANALHTSCDAVFARTAYYYRSLAHPQPTNLTQAGQLVTDHMMTLTTPECGTAEHYVSGKWYGMNDPPKPEGRIGCDHCLEVIDEKWHYTLKGKWAKHRSCCGSFIVPGDRITRYPIEFWRHLRKVLLDPTRSREDENLMGKLCFEYIIYELLGEDHTDRWKNHTTKAIEQMYNEADALVYGKKRSDHSEGPDKTIIDRMQTCRQIETSTKCPNNVLKPKKI